MNESIPNLSSFAFKERMASRLRERALMNGNPLVTARRAELYGEFLALNVYGPLRDKHIEERAISQLLEESRPIQELRGVVHIITNARSGGGHTRLFLNVLQAQVRAGLNPTVVVTRHLDPGVAREIKELGVNDVQAWRQCRVARVRIKGDVYLHIHMSDIFALACATRARMAGSRVFFINHADHTFSFQPLGGHCHVEVSGLGSFLSAQYRDVDQQFPLGIAAQSYCAPSERSPRKNHFLTIARTDKLRPASGFHFTELADYLTTSLGCTLELIGQTGREPWWDILKRNSRITFRGSVTRKELERAAMLADGYIDSYPFTGGTVLSEIALSGLPIFAIKLPFYGYSAVDSVRFESIEDLKIALKEFVTRGMPPYDARKLEHESARYHGPAAFSDRVLALHDDRPFEVPDFWNNRNYSLGEVQSLFDGDLKARIACSKDLPIADRLIYSVRSAPYVGRNIVDTAKYFLSNVVGSDF